MTTSTQTHVEYRVIGPPGTGKTTWLCRQAAKAAKAYCDRHGLDLSDCRGVLISSLTKAAAAELKKRDVEIHPDQVGTLHAHAYRSLGRPKLCVDGKEHKEWNEACPQYRFTEKGPEAADTSAGGRTLGDRLLADYHKYRARLTDRELWPVNVLAFAEQYESWKRVNHYMDFSDVIHEAWSTVETAPGNPEIIFVDEAQDHDRAELRLVRKWAEHCEKLIIVGDPDQNLYQWRGSDPEAFYEAEVPPERCRVLEQSWRVPRAVHAAAVGMIERADERQPVTYLPKDADGEVIYADLRLTHTALAGEAIDHARDYLDGGKEVMFLATCDYMLRSLCAELKTRGIAYWNPYAPDRGQFNPLHPASGLSAIDRMLAFLRPNTSVYPNFRLWTFGEFRRWTDVCYVNGLLRRGVGEWLAEQDDDTVMTGDALRHVCENDKVVCELLEPDPWFFVSKAKADRRKSIEYAANIFDKAGVEGLRNNPRVVVGTIHSVKGGEADVVYLAPDLSPEAFERFDSGRRDPIYRQFYVGMTRAKETLVLCAPKTNMSIEW